MNLSLLRYPAQVPGPGPYALWLTLGVVDTVVIVIGFFIVSGRGGKQRGQSRSECSDMLPKYFLLAGKHLAFREKPGFS
jgi:hypothetical protein